MVPPGFLSLILFILEFIMLVIMFKKTSKHPYFLTLASIMLLLQVYQLCEFLLCIGINQDLIGRVALVTITLLPPTGYFLACKLVSWEFKDYYLGFVGALFFSIYYAVITPACILVDCNPLYAVYNYPLRNEYGYYYIAYCLLAVIQLTIHLLIRKERIEKKLSFLLLIGYLAFLTPMGIMVLIDTTYIAAMTSIMCKYAFVLAVTLFGFSFTEPVLFDGEQTNTEIIVDRIKKITDSIGKKVAELPKMAELFKK